MELTKAGLKKFAVDDRLLSAVAEYLAAVAKYELIKPKIDAIYLEVFSKFKFPMEDRYRIRGTPGVSDDYGNILSPKHLYMCDLDSEEVKAYYEGCAQALVDKGYEVEWGLCPALIADCEVTEKKKALVELGRAEFGLPEIDRMESIKKFVDLLVGLAVNGPKGHKLKGMALSAA